jgi:hypothetical protein
MVKEYNMARIFLTLTIDEMTSSRCNEFNDMEHIVKKYIQFYHGKIVLWNVQHHFIFVLICLCGMLRCVGDHQAKIDGGPNSIYTKLEDRIPCTYKCIQFGDRGYVGTKFGGQTFPWVVPLRTTLPKSQESWTEFKK